MSFSRTLAGCAAFCLFALPQLCGAQGSTRGPIPADQRDIIHQMASHHSSFDRSVELTEDGYIARTTSEDPDLAALLQRHVAYMKKRIESGGMVRRWDPAYLEFMKHADDIQIAVNEIEDGLEVRATAATPEAVLVARNHAGIVSEFIEEGVAAVQRMHAPTLDESDE